LSVSVDLYRFSPSHQNAIDLGKRLSAVRREARKLENDVSQLMTYLKMLQTNRLNASIASVNAMTNRAEEKVKLTTTKRETFDSQMKSVGEVEGELLAKFRLLQSKLVKSETLIGQFHKDSSHSRLTVEAAIQPVLGQVQDIRDQIVYELSPQPKGEKSARRLSLVGVEAKPEAYMTGKSSAGDDILELQNIAETAAGNIVAEADLLEQVTSGRVQPTNPDLLADDSDPFYQILANPEFRPGWSTNFFLQEVKADGKVSFLIVRETPVRFSVNEAKANPDVLIKTQLRSARAGIKTVATVAKALNPALAALPTPSNGGSASQQVTSNMVPVTLSAIRQQDEEVRRLTLRFQEQLAKLEKELEVIRQKVSLARSNSLSAAADYESAKIVKDEKDKALNAAKNELTKAPSDAGKITAVNKCTEELKNAEDKLQEKEKILNNSNAATTLAEKSANDWAKQSFSERARPILRAFRANLAALLSVN
jgi:hypothetical protein